MVSPIKDITALDPYVKKQTTKLTQVVQNFFTKIVAIIIDSRAEEYADTDHTLRINKWFNMLMPALTVKDDLKLWKSCSDLNSIPPMIIETSIDLKSMNEKSSLVLKDDNNNPWTVIKTGGTDNKKKEIVIERWLIEFDNHEVSGSILDEIPLIYKQAIILFRTLYMMTRLMPSYKLKQLINKSNDYQIQLTNRIIDGQKPISSKGRIGLSKTIIPHQMLSDSHIVQRQFHPIQTTLGTLKVSVVYRRHYNFTIFDSEQMLSSHFLMDDKTTGPLVGNIDRSMSLSPNTEPSQEIKHESEGNISAISANRGSISSNQGDLSGNQGDISVNQRDTSTNITTNNEEEIGERDSKKRPSIQPFKVGSIGNSPPPVGSSSLERRISITSNRSASNASLVAMLRNQRGSVSSITGTSSGTNPGTSVPGTSANIPIVHPTIQNNPNIARSISSSHDNDLNPEGTPRFSSSFGSRASRRFSNTSVRQSILQQNYDQSILGTSSGSQASINPTSGFYIDDDISDFVRMIDSKNDLRLGTNLLGSVQIEGDSKDVLNKFQLLRTQHQQLTDSVNQSLILHHSPPNVSLHGSTPSSQPGSQFGRSPSNFAGSSNFAPSPSNFAPGPTNFASHTSNYGSRAGSGTNVLLPPSRKHSNSYSPGPTYPASTTFDTNLPSINSRLKPEKSRSGSIVGLSTEPKRKSIQYENVFDDEDGEDYYLKGKDDKDEEKEEDDDLLFTMSDMNLTKH